MRCRHESADADHRGGYRDGGSPEALDVSRGMTLAGLLLETAEGESANGESIAAQIAEFDRRKAEATAGNVVPHAEVVRWLETWGTTSIRPWRGK